MFDSVYQSHNGTTPKPLPTSLPTIVVTIHCQIGIYSSHIVFLISDFWEFYDLCQK